MTNMPKQSAQYNSKFQPTNDFSPFFPHETVDELIKFDQKFQSKGPDPRTSAVVRPVW